MSDTYVIVTSSRCPWCAKAKELLDIHELKYEEFNVDTYPEFRKFLKLQGLNTVPQVYQHGERIGGYENLKEYIDG